jgi:hypothetical protein
MRRLLSVIMAVGLFPALAFAQGTDGDGGEGPMTPERMNTIFLELDPDAQSRPGAARFQLDDVPVVIFYDARANRMRALVPIASTENLTEGQMLRLLQANFDTALDARYAIADGRVWSVFIHPLAELDRRQLISGVAQTVALAQTFGTTFSSSEMLFGRGDSAERLRQLMEPGEDL